MKKIYSIILTIFVCTLVNSQSMHITKVIETDCSSPFLKTVEFYVSGTIDFATDNIGVEYMNNGGAWNATVFDFTSLGSVTDSYVYLIRDLQIMTDNFPSITFDASNTVTTGTATNGDDGYRVVMDGNVISQFGKDATDADNDPADDWDHGDTIFSRALGVNDDGTWNSSQWVGEAENSIDTKSLCAISGGAGTVALETHLSTLAADHAMQSWTPPTASIDDLASNKISIYPNPLTSINRVLNIISNYNEDINVKVYDISGKEILNRQLTTNTINLSNLKTGVYIISVKQEDINISSRLIVN